jgi:hypothetical protein
MKRAFGFLLSLFLLAGCAVPGAMTPNEKRMSFEEDELQRFSKCAEFFQSHARSLSGDKHGGIDYLAMARTEAEYLSADPFLNDTAPVRNLLLLRAVFDHDNILARELAHELLDAVKAQRFGFVGRGTSTGFEEVQSVRMPRDFPESPMNATAVKWAIRIIERFHDLVHRSDKLEQEDSLMLWFFTDYGKARALKGQAPLLGYGALVVELLCDQAAAGGRANWPDWRMFGPLPRNKSAAYRNQYINAAMENILQVGITLGDEALMRQTLETMEILPAPSPSLRLVADIARYLLDGEVSNYLRSRVAIFGQLAS